MSYRQARQPGRVWQTTTRSLHENTHSHLFLCSYNNPVERSFIFSLGTLRGNFLLLFNLHPLDEFCLILKWSMKCFHLNKWVRHSKDGVWHEHQIFCQSSDNFTWEISVFSVPTGLKWTGLIRQKVTSHTSVYQSRFGDTRTKIWYIKISRKTYNNRCDTLIHFFSRSRWEDW